jgi:type VI secretion system protein ImpH
MPDLTRALLDDSTRYSFVQAYRLLKLLFARDGEAEEDALLKGIRVRPDLSLSFPPHDIISIKKTQWIPPTYSITATFLGLYGASSPLPTFYTEDLMAEASEDSTITRDFLDILNGPLYHHFFACWAKYRLFYQLVENPGSDTMERLYCLSGFGSEKIRDCYEDPYGLLRYLGLTTQIPRPADGLRVLLADALHEPGLSIEQFVSKRIEIPEDQRLVLGVQAAGLGEDTCLGAYVNDCTGQFRVHMEDLKADQFLGLLPDQPLFRKMGGLISFYVDQPLSWDVEMKVDPDEIKPCCLGRPEWSRLGWDTWLGQTESTGESTVRFAPPS